MDERKKEKREWANIYFHLIISLTTDTSLSPKYLFFFVRRKRAHQCGKEEWRRGYLKLIFSITHLSLYFDGRKSEVDECVHKTWRQQLIEWQLESIITHIQSTINCLRRKKDTPLSLSSFFFQSILVNSLCCQNQYMYWYTHFTLLSSLRLQVSPIFFAQRMWKMKRMLIFTSLIITICQNRKDRIRSQITNTTISFTSHRLSFYLPTIFPSNLKEDNVPFNLSHFQLHLSLFSSTLSLNLFQITFPSLLIKSRIIMMIVIAVGLIQLFTEVTSRHLPLLCTLISFDMNDSNWSRGIVDREIEGEN